MTICSIAPETGCTPETLRVRVRRHERDTGNGDGGLTTAERQRLKEPERENRELRRSNDILRQASAYFAKAEFDRLWKKIMPLPDKTLTIVLLFFLLTFFIMMMPFAMKILFF